MELQLSSHLKATRHSSTRHPTAMPIVIEDHRKDCSNDENACSSGYGRGIGTGDALIFLPSTDIEKKHAFAESPMFTDTDGSLADAPLDVLAMFSSSSGKRRHKPTLIDTYQSDEEAFLSSSKVAKIINNDENKANTTNKHGLDENESMPSDSMSEIIPAVRKQRKRTCKKRIVISDETESSEDDTLSSKATSKSKVPRLKSASKDDVSEAEHVVRSSTRPQICDAEAMSTDDEQTPKQAIPLPSVG